jgi:hypothetical protein
LENEIPPETVREVDPAQGEPRFKVLAAEDNPVFRSMLRNLLTKWIRQ